jgi:hypothetical protein
MPSGSCAGNHPAIQPYETFVMANITDRRTRPTGPAHRFAFEGGSIAVVHEPVEERVGERGIGKEGAPLVHRKLTGGDSGAAA